MRCVSKPPPHQEEATFAQRLDLARAWRRPREQGVQPLAALDAISAVPEARAGERGGQLQPRLELGRLEQTPRERRTDVVELSLQALEPLQLPRPKHQLPFGRSAQPLTPGQVPGPSRSFALRLA